MNLFVSTSGAITTYIYTFFRCAATVAAAAAILLSFFLSLVFSNGFDIVILFIFHWHELDNTYSINMPSLYARGAPAHKM